MKKFLSIISLALLSSHINAQSMKDILKSMPDSITPILGKNAKLDFIDYIDAGQKAVDKNLLAGESEMTHLSDTRATINMTTSSSLDIKLLKSPEPTIGIITSVHDEQRNATSSIVRYYSLEWQLLRTIVPEGFVSYSWNDENEELSSTKSNPFELKSEKIEK